MTTFHTAEPITAVVEVVAGAVHLAATDRDDTVVDIKPRDPERVSDVRAAEQARVDFHNGTLVATGGLDPRTTRIRHQGGQFTITDGPFTEAKEAVVGWAIVNVDSLEQAIELSKQFWKLVGDGTGTIQRIYDPGEMPSPAS